uniref:Uncharacterized protein n=1 Tax=Rhipicephalus zambeziensis TaxID=60191 RepID=A0A224Z247_9ACAR
MRLFLRKLTSLSTCALTQESVPSLVSTALHRFSEKTTSWYTSAPTQENVPSPALTATHLFHRNAISRITCPVVMQRRCHKCKGPAKI